MKTAVFAAAITLLSACADDHTTNTKTEALEAGIPLAGTEWVLTDYKNAKLDAALRNRSTIKFAAEPAGDEYEITGRAFINGYFGKFRIDESNGTVTPIGGIGATKMGGSREDMQAEIDYFQNLDKVTSFRIVGDDQLVLYFGDDEVGYFNKK